MKLWLLRPIPKEKVDNAWPWSPWYDKAFGFIVRADTEIDARRLASNNCGDEKKEAWTDPQYSTCAEVQFNGPAEVVIRDFAYA